MKKDYGEVISRLCASTLPYIVINGLTLRITISPVITAITVAAIVIGLIVSVFYIGFSMASEQSPSSGKWLAAMIFAFLCQVFAIAVYFVVVSNLVNQNGIWQQIREGASIFIL